MYVIAHTVGLSKDSPFCYIAFCHKRSKKSFEGSVWCSWGSRRRLKAGRSRKLLYTYTIRTPPQNRLCSSAQTVCMLMICNREKGVIAKQGASQIDTIDHKGARKIKGVTKARRKKKDRYFTVRLTVSVNQCCPVYSLNCRSILGINTVEY